MKKFAMVLVASLGAAPAFAGGLVHPVAAVNQATLARLPALPRLQAVAPAMGGMSLRGLAPMSATSLPGLAPMAASGAPGPLKQPWIVYNQTTWKSDYRSWKTERQDNLNYGIGNIVGEAGAITCTDCGGPIFVVQFIIDTGLSMLGDVLVHPVPHPKFPDGLEPFAEQLFNTTDQTQVTVGNLLLSAGGGGG